MFLDKSRYDLYAWGMNLQSYIEQVGAAQLARDLGIDPGLPRHWAKGRRQVSARLVLPLCNHSDGRLKPYELRPDIFSKSAA